MTNLEQIASEVLEDYNLKTIPVPVKKLIKKMNITLEPFDLGSDVSGVLVINNGKPKIGFNPSESTVRKRFTMAHELGHYVLKHWGNKTNDLFVDNIKVLFRKNNATNKEVKQEREANAFAAAILMPRDLIHQEYIKLDSENYTDDMIVNKLASSFKVSQIAMSYRLMNLGYINYSF